MIQLQSIWELINQVKTWNSFNAFFSPLCFELKPHKHNNRFAKNVLYVNCYCSDENAIWIEWWLKHRKKQKPRFAFWLLFQFSFYPLKYTGINTSFLTNLKANFSWETNIDTSHVCRLYKILFTKTENKPQNNCFGFTVQYTNFITWYDFHLGTWKLVI